VVEMVVILTKFSKETECSDFEHRLALPILESWPPLQIYQQGF
jgi:hypothetical protein